MTHRPSHETLASSFGACTKALHRPVPISVTKCTCFFFLQEDAKKLDDARSKNASPRGQPAAYGSADAKEKAAAPVEVAAADKGSNSPGAAWETK